MAVDQLYIDEDYIDDGHFQVGVEILWGERRIIIPRLAMELVQTTPSVVYNLDLNTFRNTLKGLEDDEAGMPFPQTHRHNTTVVLSGITFARVIEIINDYTVEFEDGQYAVNLVGANSNVADRVIVNQVSVRAANSAGLVQLGSTAAPDIPTAAEIAAALIAAAAATPINADIRRINNIPVDGSGVPGDGWGPA